jgi:hypothetical protein
MGCLGYCSLYICHVIARNASYMGNFFSQGIYAPEGLISVNWNGYLHFVEKNNARDNVANNDT